MPQPFSSMPGFPSWSEFSGMMQAQNRLLEQLPATLRTLTEVLEKFAPAANDAVEAMETSRRVTARVEALIEELELPIRELIPEIQKLTATPAANDAVQTVETSRRVTARVEAVIADLEQPIRELIPAIQKLTAVLNDPAVATIPATVQRMHEEVNPILDRLALIRGAAVNGGRRAKHLVNAVADRAYPSTSRTK
jgi:ABC-type transporter Mla subunit MlaD